LLVDFVYGLKLYQNINTTLLYHSLSYLFCT